MRITFICSWLIPYSYTGNEQPINHCMGGALDAISNVLCQSIAVVNAIVISSDRLTDFSNSSQVSLEIAV